MVTSDYTPQLSLNTSANIVCVGQMATLNVSGGQAPYAWSNSNATGASVTIPAGNYTVSNTNVCGTGTASITVLEDQVQAVITTTANSGFGPLDVDFGNNSTGASLYNWDFSNGYTSNDTLPFTTFNDVGDYIVSLVAVSPNGCFSTDTVHIRVIPEAPTLWAPNSFTPNDDGVNDLYAMKGFNIREFNCTILDRWGQEVYKWNDLDKGGWDGTVKGATATNGTYFYVVEARDINGKEIRKQGHIELVK